MAGKVSDDNFATRVMYTLYFTTSSSALFRFSVTIPCHIIKSTFVTWLKNSFKSVELQLSVIFRKSCPCQLKDLYRELQGTRINIAAAQNSNSRRKERQIRAKKTKLAICYSRQDKFQIEFCSFFSMMQLNVIIS